MLETMEINYELVKKILADYGLVGILILLIFCIFFFPDNAKTLAGWIYQFIGYAFASFRKKAIKYRIEGPSSKSLKQIVKELPEFDIPELSIDWVNEENLQTIFDDGKAIVKLKFSNDQTRNVIKATTVYVRDAFLKHSKPYLSEQLKKSLDFSITRKILLNLNKNKKNIVSQFIEDNITDIELKRDKCSQIEEIDDNGLLTSVLIRELDYFGTKLFGRIPTNENQKEADEFLDFLYEIAIREPDDLTPLQFARSTLKVGVLLVAKRETYYNQGLNPYLRRIKLGLAQGIETFYLLAREDKVEILKRVASELLGTGNFVLINNPREFKDTKSRDVICYCMRVNSESLITQTLKEISELIKQKGTITGVITNVKDDGLKVDVDGIEGYIKNQNLSIIEITEPWKFFKTKSYIELIPIEILSNGIVEFTLKGTKSDPNEIIQTNFEIGKSIFATVKYCDDNFITLNIGNDRIQGIAFRKHLTFSRYLILNDKFKVDLEFEFIIHGYDFERNRIILKLKEFTDPWLNIKLRKNIAIQFLPMKKTEKVFVGEVGEGIEAILPFYELSWLTKDLNNIKGGISLNKPLNCFIKEIEKDNRLIILTLKHCNNNPYVSYFKENKGSIVFFKITEIDEYGIHGLIENTYSIYIPKYEQSWDGFHFEYRVHQSYKVFIKGIDKYPNRLIGSFKPIIVHPLTRFSTKFHEGQALKYLQIESKFEWGCVVNIIDGKRTQECLLFNSEISDHCFIKSSSLVLQNIETLPLIIKSIDFEKNRVLLSLKELTNKNIERILNVTYDNSFESIVLGKKGNNYCVLLTGIWVEGLLESSKNYSEGSIVNVRPSSITDQKVILTDE
jgi:small subunit ribosomal protein S1